MTIDIDASRTAIVTNECQRGAIGSEAAWPALRDAATPMVPALARLLGAARVAAVPVLHLMVVRDPDAEDPTPNAPLFARSAGRRNFERGTPAAGLQPDLGPEPSDLVVEKAHGLAPMRSIGLDARLRELGAETLVVTGVSLNVAIPFLTFEAVNLGFRVVIPSDAVAGVPGAFAEDVLRHSLSLVATVTTTNELIDGLLPNHRR